MSDAITFALIGIVVGIFLVFLIYRFWWLPSRRKTVMDPENERLDQQLKEAFEREFYQPHHEEDLANLNAMQINGPPHHEEPIDDRIWEDWRKQITVQ